MRWTEGHLAASQRPWRRRPRRGRSAWHACGWVSREPGRPRRLHRKDRRGAGTGSPSPRPWTSHLASDGANRRCSEGTAGRRQRSAGGWAARSRRVSEYRRSGGIEPTRPRGGKGAPAGGTGGGKDGQHTEVGSRLHVTTTDSRTGQTSLRDGGGHRLASWTSGYATARSEAVCRGAGCGRTRTSGSVGGQGQQRPWSTRPVGAHTAAELLIVFGDNPDRIRSEAAFAKLCGACPIPASSGMTTGRHRLNRGGHRHTNAALYRAIIVRMRYHQPTVDDVARRTAAGRTKREIIRCLKRFLAREIYQRVMTDFRTRQAVTQAA